MRRAIGTLLAAALATTAIAIPVAADDDDGYECERRDVRIMANMFDQAINQFAAGRTDGKAAAWINCQARLYDDNDDPNDPFGGPKVDNPEVPHVWTEDEFFLLGIFQWVTEAQMEEFGLTREQAIADLRTVKETVWWGRADKPDSKMKKLRIRQSSYRDWDSPLFGPLVVNHRYVIFKPGQLDEGTYKWRWLSENPFLGDFEARGEVVITDD